MKEYIVFIDLDKTLLRVNSGVGLIKAAYLKKLLPAGKLLQGFFFALLHKLNPRDDQRIISRMADWLTGHSEKEIADLVMEVFNTKLASQVRPEMIREIDRHRNQKARLVMLSSALCPVCFAFTGFLHLDDFICSDFEIVDGVYASNNEGRICFGEVKMHKLMDYCRNNHFSLHEAWYYADSYSDLPALAAVGHPVCINPGPRLRSICRKSGWEIRRFT